MKKTQTNRCIEKKVNEDFTVLSFKFIKPKMFDIFMSFWKTNI